MEETITIRRFTVEISIGILEQYQSRHKGSYLTMGPDEMVVRQGSLNILNFCLSTLGEDLAEMKDIKFLSV